MVFSLHKTLFLKIRQFIGIFESLQHIKLHTQFTYAPTDLAFTQVYQFCNVRAIEKIRKIVLSLLLDTRKQFNLLSYIKGLWGVWIIFITQTELRRIENLLYLYTEERTNLHLYGSGIGYSSHCWPKEATITENEQFCKYSWPRMSVERSSWVSIL